MKNVVATVTAAAMMGGLLMAGSGMAHAAPPRPAVQAWSVSASGDDHGDGGPGELFVDPRQEYNVSNCYFDKSKSGQERAKYCKALEGGEMTEAAKNCLVRAGIGGAAALIVGRVNKKVAREIAVNTVAGGVTGCLSALVK
ncbi:hypothetical protein EF912_32370 [Streptomyces sp. WAC07061]|uniref:hypothetical protein n=1 Tax=Streptomyces sp. WAC07061 TaxID=2487410 RepID=UPI000F787F3F|nr:hypothetical protein [Streptomyces sp. WAC07061]RSS40309.1 hypothetical protein EF912_32370 [Streptomyces sp. WAC07061]